MYKSHSEIGKSYSALDKVTGRRHKEREYKWKEIKSNIPDNSNIAINIMCSNEYVIRPLLRVQYEKNKMMRTVYSEMKSKQIKCHFSSHIRNSSNLDHYAKSNIFTKHNKWLKFMYSPEENNQKMIAFTCQEMMSYLYICYEITISAGPKNIKSSFWYNAISFWNQDSFATLVNTFPASVRSKPCFIILIYILSDILFKNVDDSISTIKNRNSSST